MLGRLIPHTTDWRHAASDADWFKDLCRTLDAIVWPTASAPPQAKVVSIRPEADAPETDEFRRHQDEPRRE